MKKIWLSLIVLMVLLGACNVEEPIIETETGVEKKEIDEGNSAPILHDVSQFEEFPLVSIVDGDTIKINYNGSTELVRFLLVDTPETNHPTIGEQPFGQDAKTFTKQLLEGQDKVYLEFDVTYRDKFQRLLAYIYTVDGVSIQEELLKNGLARVAYIYAPNTKHVDWFDSIQKVAQKQAVGIWSVEDYVTNRGFDKTAIDENNPKKESIVIEENDCGIKGNINSKGNKIYHSPGQQNYDDTVPEEMFCTAEEAEKAGYKAASR
jgi:micrococcal nuclease